MAMHGSLGNTVAGCAMEIAQSVGLGVMGLRLVMGLLVLLGLGG